MMVRRLADGFVSLGSAVEQVGESTYAAKLDPAEFVLDFTKRAADLVRVVRLGFAWTTLRGKRLKVLDARPIALEADAVLASGLLRKFDGALVVGCGGPDDSATKFDALVLLTVQPEGKGPMAAAAWANGLGRLEETMLGQ
jgi:methionyl-tRNA formyltransferase